MDIMSARLRRQQKPHSLAVEDAAFKVLPISSDVPHLGAGHPLLVGDGSVGDYFQPSAFPFVYDFTYKLSSSRAVIGFQLAMEEGKVIKVKVEQDVGCSLLLKGGNSW